MSKRWALELPFRAVLERARAMDHEALSLLYRQYLDVVYWYILARVSDVNVAEDVTSETFLAAIDSMDHVRADDELTFEGWLLSIARNKVADHYRRQASRPATRAIAGPWEEPIAPAESGDPLGVVIARESWAEVVAALQQLTEEQRTVLIYRCLLGYDTDEVAHLMDRQPGAIRALQFRALASLARFLAKNGTNPHLMALRTRLSARIPQPRLQRSADGPRR